MSQALKWRKSRKSQYTQTGAVEIHFHFTLNINMKNENWFFLVAVM